MTTETLGWPLLTRLLHWIMAVMILMMLVFGTMMANNEDIVAKFTQVQTHKSMGFTVFCLALLRVLWRFVSPAPPPAPMPRWQAIAATSGHHLLYLLMFAVPLSGWLMVSASPLNDPGAYPEQIRNMVWGFFEMPDPFATGSEELSTRFRMMHGLLTKLLIAILALHVAGALKHALIDRDGVMRRMVRGRP